MLLATSTLNNLVPEVIAIDDDRSLSGCGQLRAVATSLAFEFAVAAVIVYSSISLILWVDYTASSNSIFFTVSDILLSLIFFAEWWLRFWVHGWSALKHGSFMFLTFLVFVPGAMPYLSITFGTQPGDYSFVARCIALITTLRMLHVLRLFELVGRLQQHGLFPELWLLLRGLRMSSSVLLSAMSLMIFCLYMFGIAAVDLIGTFPDNVSDEVNQTYATTQAQAAFSKFENLRVGLVTLVRILNFDDAQIIIDWLHGYLPGIGIFFWGFLIPIMSFVLLNLVTAVIVQQALDIARADEEKLEHGESDLSMQELTKVFEAFTEAASEDGLLSLKRMQDCLREKRGILATQSFSREDLEDLFELLDVLQTGQVQVDEFIKAIGQLDGQAKSTDMILLVEATNRILKQVERLHNTLDMEKASSQWHAGMIDRLEKLDDSIGQVFAGCAADAMMAKEELEALDGATLSSLGVASAEPSRMQDPDESTSVCAHKVARHVTIPEGKGEEHSHSAHRSQERRRHHKRSSSPRSASKGHASKEADPEGEQRAPKSGKERSRHHSKEAKHKREDGHGHPSS